MTQSFKWTADIIKKDAIAGTITGLMAIPLTVGICLMSEYPIQTGLLTVIFSCVIGFVTFLFRPGNYVGTPGVAAGLAPVLALGIHTFGMQNMPFLIFLTTFFQMIVWYNKWESYILKAVPSYLVEGLLAGVGIKIALKFLPYTHEITHEMHEWTTERMELVVLSALFMVLFVYLFNKFKKTSPGAPYVVTIVASILIAHYVKLPMLHIDNVPFAINLPLPNIDMHHPIIIIQMIGYAMMLTTIDIIEQVMSNLAIGKLDALKRPTNSNNSLLGMWLGNLASSFFGGMTNLDGLAKSTTNAMAGAVTKLSNIFTVAVLLFFVIKHEYLEFLPNFSLAVLMIFTGWRMIAGVFHVASEGKYAFILSLFCCILVWKMGIFEGLLISLAIHSFITYFVYRHHDTPNTVILKKFFQQFADEFHPHSTATLQVLEDEKTGGKRYVSINKAPSDFKSLTNFLNDWKAFVDKRSLLGVVGLYNYNGLLWGTFAHELRPGHPNIKKYFAHLFENENLGVHFDSHEIRQYGNVFIQSGAYTFSFTQKGKKVVIPARYSFVCRKERNSWIILEHHSSQFPA
jgi:MFS superfamily sulfate permease-like transporter